MAAARMSLRAAAGSTAGVWCGGCEGIGPGCGRGSGGEGSADADLGGRGPGGQVRSAGREARPSLGFPVAVPVAVGVDAAAGQAGQDGVAAGRLAVAAPDRVEVMSARRAAVKEISRGCTAWPARLPLPAGTAMPAAARAAARASSVAVIQAACSWATRAGDCERSIGPVDGPAPRI